MANVFGEFPEIQTVDEAVGKAAGKIVMNKNSFGQSKKRSSRIKKLTREVKRLNKLLRKIFEQHPEQEQAKNEKSASDRVNEEFKKDTKTEKSFWGRVGDVFLKTLPSILRTMASLSANMILGRRFQHTGYTKRSVA